MFFFYPLDMERQRVHSNNNSIDSRFVYIWKVVHIQKTKLPMVITNQASLTFYSPAAPYSFCLSSWRSTANSSSAMLSYTYLWIFYPMEFNQAKRRTLEGSALTGHLNFSSLTLFSLLRTCWGRNTCNRRDAFTLSTLLWLFVYFKDPIRIWRNVF